MRFAIALLTVICIVSAIGTVIKQGEPLVNYVDQFGPYWADVFGALGLYRIYSTPWFLVILAFLVVSTSLCIARNTPKILVDLRTHKEHVRERALDAFHHKASGQLALPLDQAAERVATTLKGGGWTQKSQRRAEAVGGAGIMIGARHGAVNKLGYIAAHSAIVLICLGGLFDGDLIVKVQAWMHGLQPFRGGEATERSRLSDANPAYRAQLFVPEGQRTNSAVISLDKGMLLQPLPFDIELKKFTVDYYATGMPKRFASDIVIHDPKLDKPKAFTVEVNHPVTYGGITIFQSSFEDGGSAVHLKPLFLNAAPNAQAPLVDAVVGGDAQNLPANWWQRNGQDVGPMALEVTGLRVINVEDLAQAQSGNPAVNAAKAANDARGVNLDELSKHLGSGAKAPGEKKLINIGPSITYKLRDAAGQAREYQNYMVPVNLDGLSVFLLGVRDTPAEGFRYLRVPADDQLQINGWLRLKQALGDAAARQEAARRFAVSVTSPDHAQLREQLSVSALRALDLFSGAKRPVPDGSATAAAAANGPSGGLMAISNFIEAVVPPAEREHTSATLIRILNGSLFELLNISREQAGLKPLLADNDAARAFMTQSVLSLSDAVFYPVPVILALDGFEQKQASVFQVTRTPGRNVVYLGCLLLVVGVFAMLYIRERRLWVWMQDDGQGGTRLKMALSSTRHTLDIDREFEQLRAVLLPSQG
ncbi:MAG: cytochrome c biogenesis protein ResB [Burkholderiales bacterium]|nr:cytochrome c biogenesis protein ResB [Burkholderiales bacterium]